MKQLDRFAHLISGRHKRDFIEMHWGVLALLGSLSFLVAGYWGLAISTVIPGLIDATNKFGLPLIAVGQWLLVGIYAVGVWYFGCIASRCHTVLYDRWFK